MNPFESMEGGGRKREIVFLEVNGKLIAMNKRTLKERELKVTRNGKLVYMDNNKYVDNFKSQYATPEFNAKYREKIDRELQIRSQKRRDKKALRENVRQRCPNGTRKNRRTGQCEPKRGVNPQKQVQKMKSKTAKTNQPKTLSYRVRQPLSLTPSKTSLKYSSSRSKSQSKSQSKSKSKSKVLSRLVQSQQKILSRKSDSTIASDTFVTAQRPLTPLKHSPHHKILIHSENGLENIGIKRGDFFEDTCIVLKKLKNEAMDKNNSYKWDATAIAKIHHHVPYLKTSTREGNQFYLNRRIDEIGSLQLYYGNKPLKVRNFIAEGGFGAIFECEYAGKSIVLKQNVGMLDNATTNKKENDQIIYEHYKESIIHNELFCRLRNSTSAEKAKIPKPLFMAKYSFQLNGQDISVPVLGMEKLQYSLSSYIRMTRQQMDRKEISKEQCKTLLENVLILSLTKVCLLLEELQEKFMFVHRDLHIGNVMIDLSRSNHVSVYLIDFGYSTMMLDGVRINGDAMGIYKAYTEQHEENEKCHDLRLFILSLFSISGKHLNGAISPALYKWISNLYSMIEGNLDHYNIKAAGTRGGPKWWRGYESALKHVNTPAFEPKNFKCILKNNEMINELLRDNRIFL